MRRCGVRIVIEATELPGDYCGPGPDFPEGHHNVHVAIQGRKGQDDLYNLTRANANSIVWELDCEVVAPPPMMDLKGAQIHGAPGKRFLYVTWGVVDAAGFRMFRRAKLMLDAIPSEVMSAAHEAGVLIGRLGLTDAAGWPLCAAIRPPKIAWIGPPSESR